MTRALRDGSAEKIARARERENQAYAEADTTERYIEDMQKITGTQLTDLGQLIVDLGSNLEADGQASRSTGGASRPVSAACR